MSLCVFYKVAKDISTMSQTVIRFAKIPKSACYFVLNLVS